MLKSVWVASSPSIKSIINEASFNTFFKALSNHETYEYKDLQLFLALAECFWDTTCTFHFPNIREVMLTPYNFSIITGLRLGGKRILVHDSLTSTELKKILGVMPSRMRSNNIPLSWLCGFWSWKLMCITFVLQSFKSRDSLQMLKRAWEALSPSIKNIIDEADFGAFFEALSNHETYEYRDL